MITEQNLVDLGFNNSLSPYTGKKAWTLGQMATIDYMGYPTKTAVVHYSLETQYCKTIAGEFSVIDRKCETEDEIKKFVECIKFLLNLSDEEFNKEWKGYV
jgi:hypothetical protein